MLQGEDQEVGDGLEGGLVLGREGARTPGSHHDVAFELLPPQEGHGEARAHALLLDPPVHGEGQVQHPEDIVNPLGPVQERPRRGGEIFQADREGRVHLRPGNRVELQRALLFDPHHAHPIEGQNGGRGFCHAREDLPELQGSGDDTHDAAKGVDEGIGCIRLDFSRPESPQDLGH